MYCSCGKAHKGGHAPAKELDGGEWDFNYDLWVCWFCRLPSRATFEGITGMLTPYGAQALLSTHGLTTGIWETVWAMPDGSRKTTLYYAPYPKRYPDMMDQGRGLLQQLWALLDLKVNVILAEPKSPHGDNSIQATDRDWARQTGRGVAESISILMAQFYPTSDSVVKEAVARHKARAAGSDHETPGLAEHLWDPRPPVAAKTTPAPKFNVPKSSTKQLTDEERDGIKTALESGMFGPEEIAGMFKVTVDQVKATVGD